MVVVGSERSTSRSRKGEEYGAKAATSRQCNDDHYYYYYYYYYYYPLLLQTL